MWIKDPKSKEDSVSLTLLMTTFVICMVATALEAASIIHTTSMAFEMFGAASGLYFGRKFTGSKNQVIDKE
jgi:uncharacterized membrane protein YhhN